MIEGSQLQLSRREFCQWWLRGFENAGCNSVMAIISVLLSPSLIIHFLKYILYIVQLSL